MKSTTLNYDPEKDFPSFLKALRQQKQIEWQWLLDEFRTKVKPWIFKVDRNLPPGTIASEDEFVEEVFLHSLVKFSEQFQKGEFKSLADLRGLVFRIAEFKLKEGYHKIRRDRLIFFTDDLGNPEFSRRQDDLTIQEVNDREVVAELKDQLGRLNKGDREILIRYARGEELGSIAINLNLEPAACRKRKQRALVKLKKLVLKGLNK